MITYHDAFAKANHYLDDADLAGNLAVWISSGKGTLIIAYTTNGKSSRFCII